MVKEKLVLIKRVWGQKKRHVLDLANPRKPFPYQSMERRQSELIQQCHQANVHILTAHKEAAAS